MKNIDAIFENSVNNKTDSGTKLVTNKDAQGNKDVIEYS